MPETRTEWLLFLVGLIVIGGLGVAIAFGRAKGHPAKAASPPAATSPSTGGTTGSTTSPGAPATSSATPFDLELRARVDTWLSVHRGTRAGPVLYEGTLTAGKKKSFSGTGFWVRFGEASNVAAKLDGVTLRLPGGTYSTPITRRGLGTRA